MFEDRSDLITDNTPFTGYGAAVTAGVDGPIILVAGFGCSNQLLSWDGSELQNRACGIIADANRQGIGVAAADLDCDGDEELYVHNTDAYSGVSRNTDLLLDRTTHDGRAVWCDAFALDVNADRGNFNAGRSVAAVDRFGTGRYGMVVVGCESPTRFYELGDDGEITDMADTVGLNVVCGGRSVLSAPLVSEGMDIFIGVESGPNRLLRNDDGHFTDIAESVGVDAPTADARGACVVDDGSGSFALAVGSWGDRNHLFVHTETGYRDCAPKAFAEPTRVRTVLAADFDNDGRQELFCNVLGGKNRLFAPTVSDSNSTASNSEWEQQPLGAATEPEGLGTGAVVADCDNDGTVELLVVHGEIDAQPLSLFDVPTDNDWLRVRPTTQYGAPARGAVVTLRTDRGRQQRVIDAGSSYLCQSEPVAHFGLGGASVPHHQPQSVTVRWPDGRSRTIEEIQSNTTHAISHPNAA